MALSSFFNRILGNKIPLNSEEIDPMKKFLIAGLGNIGPKYNDTRHNIGFKILDAFAKANEATWETEKL
ncbi:MAG: aminoacyl-tRNA hydrolase, partial [Leeuwenhoekiella sp.]